MSVAGTPADCVRLGFASPCPAAELGLGRNQCRRQPGNRHPLFRDRRGCSRGVIHGVPGIAFSQYQARGLSIDWTQASRWAEAILAVLLARPWETGTFWNVNLPHLGPGKPDPEIVFCPLDPSPLPLVYRVDGDISVYAGNYQSRDRRAGGDVATCFGGNISVSLVRVADSDSQHAQSAAHKLSRKSLKYRRTVGLNRKTAQRSRRSRRKQKVWLTRGGACHNKMIDRCRAWRSGRIHPVGL